MPQQRDATPSRPPRDPPPTLSGRINRLFEVHRPPGAPERQYHNKEVVAACRAAGRDISESHLSELRRGRKENPTLRTLETIAWFFEVRPGYFTDPQTAADVEDQLAEREAELVAQLEADRAARADMAAAARELQHAIRTSGVTKVAHRATRGGMDSRERAATMRALARIILEDERAD